MVKQAQTQAEMKNRDFPEIIHPRRIYTTAAAAKILGCSQKAIIKLINDEELTARMPGNGWRMTGRSLLAYMGIESAPP
jgi:excisionase family DNA binding protein